MSYQMSLALGANALNLSPSLSWLKVFCNEALTCGHMYDDNDVPSVLGY